MPEKQFISNKLECGETKIVCVCNDKNLKIHYHLNICSAPQMQQMEKAKCFTSAKLQYKQKF